MSAMLNIELCAVLLPPVEAGLILTFKYTLGLKHTSNTLNDYNEMSMSCITIATQASVIVGMSKNIKKRDMMVLQSE